MRSVVANMEVAETNERRANLYLFQARPPPPPIHEHLNQRLTTSPLRRELGLAYSSSSEQQELVDESL